MVLFPQEFWIVNLSSSSSSVIRHSRWCKVSHSQDDDVDKPTIVSELLGCVCTRITLGCLTLLNMFLAIHLMLPSMKCSSVARARRTHTHAAEHRNSIHRHLFSVFRCKYANARPAVFQPPTKATDITFRTTKQIANRRSVRGPMFSRIPSALCSVHTPC